MDLLIEVIGSYILHLMRDKTVSLWLRILLGISILMGYLFCIIGIAIVAWGIWKEHKAVSVFLLCILLYLLSVGITFLQHKNV